MIVRFCLAGTAKPSHNAAVVKRSRIALALALLVALAVSGGARAANVEGVALDDAIEVAGVPLVLNGAGLRSKFLVSGYVIGLYLPSRTTSAEAVLDGQVRRRVRLVLKRGFGADMMWSFFEDGIRRNATPAELALMEKRLWEVERAFREIGEVHKGDVVDIDMAADGSGEVRYRGQLKGSFSGADLSRVLLKIWLGENPVQSDLKEALLRGR